MFQKLSKVRQVNIYFRYVAQDIDRVFFYLKKKEVSPQTYVILIWHFRTVAFKSPECHERSFPFVMSDKEMS